MKNQKGITLVALIITIIVMLILAGVSISLVVGDNGVLTQAESTKVANVKGAIMDAISMANADIVATHYSNSAGEIKAADPAKMLDFIKDNLGDSSITVSVVGTPTAGVGGLSLEVTQGTISLTFKADLVLKGSTSQYLQILNVVDTTPAS